MLSHALTSGIYELGKHLIDTYSGRAAGFARKHRGGVAGAAASMVPREVLAFSTLNIREERTLENHSAYQRNNANLRVVCQYPQSFEFHFLVAATHASYSKAPFVLSRAIKFFRFANLFEEVNHLWGRLFEPTLVDLFLPGKG
jgi:hypothetical protein